MWFFYKSFNLAVHFSWQLSWRHNNLPKSKLQMLNVEVDHVSQLFVTLPLSMPVPPWHLLSERAGCSASNRVFENHSLTGHEPPAACCTLSHTGHDGRRAVALSGANVSARCLACALQGSLSTTVVFNMVPQLQHFVTETQFSKRKVRHERVESWVQRHWWRPITILSAQQTALRLWKNY